jgi:hypothetical protein
MREQISLRPLALVVSGLLVWGAHFTLIYAFNSYVCTRGLADDWLLGMNLIHLVIGVLTLLALLVLAGIMLAVVLGHRPHLHGTQGEALHGFTQSVTLLVLAISALAVFTQAVPAYIVPACA